MIKKDQRSKIKDQIKKSKFFPLILGVLIIYFLFVSLRNSLFFNRKDRLNILVYGQQAAFYSYGFKDGVNYFISYPSDIKIMVPGGFGYYRLGALGKLVELEKTPDILKKAFSNVSGSFVDYYFYTKKSEIFFGQEKKVVFFPRMIDFFVKSSNASIIDRFYIYFLFLTKQKNNFKQISDLPIKKESGDIYLDEKKFYDDQLGFFYQESLRIEKANVQIIYSEKVENATLLSNIIEGQGVRVVDISYKQGLKNCFIIEDKDQNLKTAEILSDFFGCPKKKGKTNPYDVILEMGKKEREWGI